LFCGCFYMKVIGIREKFVFLGLKYKLMAYGFSNYK
jgi:hypothetical protein